MKILIIKTSSLGDIIHAFPVLAYLKQIMPHAEVDWVVEKPFTELVKAHPLINRTLVINSKRWRKSLFDQTHWSEFQEFRRNLQQVSYDVVLDLQSNIKSGIITALSYSKKKVGYGWSTVHEKPNALFTNVKINPPKNLNIREELLYLVQDYFGDPQTPENIEFRLNISSEEKNELDSILSNPVLAANKLVMVCPGSQWENKQLSPETLIALLRYLLKEMNCKFLFIWGTQKEYFLAQELYKIFPDRSLVIQRLSLPTLQNLIAKMHLVISMDSLPLHLAGTTSVPTFGLFGPSSALKYMPVGPQHRFYQGACPYGRTFEKRCPILRTCPTGACMKKIRVEDMLQESCRKEST